ncbi:MAG TPA: ABC transporter ATP-binding protein [Candidatus Limnocylindrales bacterium]|nr:ABC transporter ATP-binding protein [Candidatus Limnocylindrales bacterium]
MTEHAIAEPVAPAPLDHEILVSTRRLTKRYEERVAVDRLDLEVRAGEIFGLLGQNGAGKTTTILMLLGLTEPTSGEARVAGLDPQRSPLEVKRRVGYLPDAVGFYGDLTGRQNLRYTARLNGLPSGEAGARIGEVLEQVGLTDRADTRVDTYSRGMLQRLGIADALVKDPDLLILDEPTTAIDPIGVVEILDLLRRLVRERELAILLSSHLLTQVQSVCDRIGIFAAGRLIAQGTLDELARRYGSEAGELLVGVEPATAHARDEVAALLRSVDGAAAVETIEDGEDGDWRWRVDVAAGRDLSEVRAATLAAVTGAGFRLADLGRRPPSLEEIYRRAVERAAVTAGANPRRPGTPRRSGSPAAGDRVVSRRPPPQSRDAGRSAPTPGAGT